MPLLVLALATPAMALRPPWDAEFFHVADCYTYNSLETVYDDLAADAQAANTRVFGAVQVVEDHVLTYETNGESALMGRYGNRVVWDAVRVPGTLVGECDALMGDVPHDVMAYSLSFGLYLGENVTLFYTGATTTTWAIMDPMFRALTTTTFGTFTNAMYTFAAPAYGAGTYYRDANAFHVDYVAGMEADFGVGDLRAGYIGTRGLYASGRVDKAHVSAILTDGFGNLAYLLAGLEELDILPEAAGLTELAARKLQFAVGPPAPMASPGGAGAVDEGGDGAVQSLWTGSLRQNGIAGRYDVDVGARVYPPSFHHLVMGVHSRGYQDPRRWKQDPPWVARAGLFWAAPEHYYGVGGGPRLFLEGGVEAGANEIRLRLNHPDTLDLFPTAVNSVEFIWAYSLGQPL